MPPYVLAAVDELKSKLRAEGHDVFDFGLGLYFDFTIAADPQLDEWLGSLVISLWFVAPAYYFNFKIARYGVLYQER